MRRPPMCALVPPFGMRWERYIATVSTASSISNSKTAVFGTLALRARPCSTAFVEDNTLLARGSDCALYFIYTESKKVSCRVVSHITIFADVAFVPGGHVAVIGSKSLPLPPEYSVLARRAVEPSHRACGKYLKPSCTIFTRCQGVTSGLAPSS